MRADIAVFLRTEHGPFQQLLVQQNARGYSLEFFEAFHGIAARTPFSPGAEFPFYIRSISQVRSRVCLFVNRSLVAVNALFIDALYSQALRSDCGAVCGIALREDRRILNSNEIFDRSYLPPFQEPAQDVLALEHSFFALRRECLAEAGGLSILSPANTPEMVARITGTIGEKGLRILRTRCAVATVGPL